MQNRTDNDIKVGHLQTLISSRGWKVLCELLDKEYAILDNRTHIIDPSLSAVIYSAKDLDCAKMAMINRIKKIPNMHIESQKVDNMNVERSLDIEG